MLIIGAFIVLDILIQLADWIFQLGNVDLFFVDSLSSRYDILVLLFLDFAKMTNSFVVWFYFIFHCSDSGLESSVIEFSNVDEILKSSHFLVVLVWNSCCISVITLKSFDILSLSINLAFNNTQLSSQIIELIGSLIVWVSVFPKLEKYLLLILLAI